jgi:ribonuclease P protein subunit RPR2
MAKKGKDEAPNPHSVSNRDIIQRLNFLYQAGVYMNTISSGSGSSQSMSTSSVQNEECTKKRRKRRKGTTSDLAKAYVSSMKTVGQRTTVKMSVV